MKKTLGLIAAFLALATPCLAGDRYAKIHTVAVISAIGDAIRFHGDPYAKGPPNWDLKIGDWNLDEKVTAEITRALAGRFEFKPIVLDAFDREYLCRGPFSADENFHRRIRQFVQHRLAGRGVDAYILVHKQFNTSNMLVPDAIGGVTGAILASIQPQLFGLQVQHYTPKQTVYVEYAIDVIDANGSETIDGTDRDLFNGPITHLNDPEADNVDMWADSEAELTAEKRDALKTIVTSLVIDNLPQNLEKLGFARQPPPGADSNSAK